MEYLKYVIEDSTIAKLLGIQNFTSDEAAVLELVKNSYDAEAVNLTLEFKSNSLTIKDDGKGMSDEDIKRHWMHIGKSDKGYEVLDKYNNKRIQAGSKGVGRFALARLGEYIELLSKKKDSIGVFWKTDWNNSTIEYIDSYEETGTCIQIKSLRNNWTLSRIRNLTKYLEKTYNDTSMKINIISGSYNVEVNPYFPDVKIGINCRSYIKLQYKDGMLGVDVISDEFTEEAKKYYFQDNLNHFYMEVNVYDELQGNEYIDISNDELSDVLNQIGHFSANFYFNLSATKQDQEKFLYKFLNTIEPTKPGIILYRNAFSISSYEGEKDWLGLGRRSRMSPAAASHPTGAWRVRENQISGFVQIDKKENQYLQDLMNRQSMDENIFYKVFVQIILIGLKEFERYRQGIIRSIDLKNKTESLKKNRLIDKIIRNPKKLEELSKKENEKFISELKNVKRQEHKVEQEKAAIEARYKYDVRILNVLSTIGLKAASIAHELKNDRNILVNSYTNIIQALKDYEMWDILTSPENQQIAYKNVPLLLDQSNDIAKKLVTFMNIMLSNIEKKSFKYALIDIKTIVLSIVNEWSNDYKWVNIEFIIDDNLKFTLSEDIIRVILDNLILNSIQQNEFNQKLDISINISFIDNKLHFIYSDNGKGLDKKYHSNPKKILEVLESTRKNGHGLGMWMINNTINLSGGEIIEIKGTNGFKIEFNLGDKS